MAKLKKKETNEVEETTVIGLVGVIQRNKIMGRAREVGSKSPTNVTLFINDVEIETTLANKPRKKIAKANELLNTACGYNFELKYPISSEDKIVVKAGKALAPLTIHRKAQEDLASFPKNKKEKNVGDIDMLSSYNIRGWAFDQNNPYLQSSVDILVNGKKIGICKANKIRTDLRKDKKHSTGICGFEFMFDKPLKLGDKVSVCFSKSKKMIQEDPITIEYSPDEKLKVLLIGLPKSGTTILTYRIAEAFPFEPRIYFEPGGKNGLNDVQVHKMDRHENFSITKSLFLPLSNIHNKCSEICELYDKIVWIIRDPRDQFVSNFFYRWYFLHRPSPINFKKSYALTIQKESNPSSVPFLKLHEDCINADQYFKHGWGESMDQIKKIKSDILLLKYEDFVDNKLESLNEYLELEINENIEVPNHRLMRVARTKKYGNWRNWFTPEDVAFYKPMLSDYLAFFGYDPDDWELNNPEKLSSKEGSEYMKRMFTKPEK